MRRFKFLLIVLSVSLCSTTLAQTRWTQLNSGVYSYLRDLSFVSANVGWIAGHNGTILKTTDAGFTWTVQTTNTSLDLYTIKFINENIGWAGGQSGILLHTTNGGESWSTTNLPQPVYSLDFFNENEGCAVMSIFPFYLRKGFIVKTTDSGVSWSNKVSLIDTAFIDIFVQDMNAWAVGTSGVCYKSTDKGETWAPKNIRPPNWLFGIYAEDENLAWAVGGDLTTEAIFKTTNGGSSWITVKRSSQYWTLSGVSFLNPDDGWAVGYEGVILKTTNGGSTWVLENSTVNNYLRKVEFINSQKGFAIGSSGRILRYGPPGTINVLTPNGGETLISGTKYDIKWTSQDVTNVKIEFSFNIGTNWNIIENSVPSNGIYSWLVPDIQTIRGRVKISDASDSTNYDISDERFNITMPSGIKDNSNENQPTTYELMQNYPNPFNPSTIIKFALPEGTFVSLKIYDVMGMLIKDLISEYKPSGIYEVQFDASHYPSGIYYYRLQAGKFTETKKMILLK